MFQECCVLERPSAVDPQEFIVKQLAIATTVNHDKYKVKGLEAK